MPCLALLSGPAQGALAALGAGATWAVGTVLVLRALNGDGSDRPRPRAAAANLFKNLLAALVFTALWLALGGSAPSGSALRALCWSGVLGFALGDMLYFSALPRCGAHLTAILSNAAPPVAALFSFLFLDESLSLPVIASMVVVLGGILLVLSDPRRLARTDVAAAPGQHRLGVVLALAAAVTWAMSIVAGHAGMGGVGIVPGTVVRLLGGLVGTVVVAVFLGFLPRGAGEGSLRELARPLHTPAFAKALLVPGFFAAVLTLPLHSFALREAAGGVAAVLFATTPLFTLPLTLVLGERVGWRTVLGTAVGFAGVAGVILLGDEPRMHQGGEAPSDAAGLVTSVPVPAPPGSAEPHLARGADGELYLTWTEHRAEGLAVLSFARWEGAGWSAAREIARGRDWFVNWADVAGLAALEGGELIAYWLQKSAAGTYAYDVRYSLSRDGGESWSASAILHSDRRPEEHGFVSIAALDDERFLAIWLDGRRLSDAKGAMTLQARTIAVGGELGAETELDPRVCDCCPTSLVRTAGGEWLVAYRDRGPDERRDISFVRFDGEHWSGPRDVALDGWIHQQCPVNGPALAAGAPGSDAAAAWYTEVGGAGAVWFARSDGAGFGPPLRVDVGAPLGRADLVACEDGGYLVLWLEAADPTDSGERRASWKLRRIAPDGAGPATTLGPPLDVARVPAARSSGLARMERAGELVVLAWTMPGEQPRVATAVLRLP